MRKLIAAVVLVVVGLVALRLLSGGGCHVTRETRLVTVQEGKAYGCRGAVLDSQPPQCAARPGTSDNPLLRGPAAGRILVVLGPAETGRVEMVVDCDRVISVKGT
jgi:hypothetical protein